MFACLFLYWFMTSNLSQHQNASFSAQAATRWSRELCLSLLSVHTKFDPCFLTMIHFPCWILHVISESKREQMVEGWEQWHRTEPRPPVLSCRAFDHLWEAGEPQHGGCPAKVFCAESLKAACSHISDWRLPVIFFPAMAPVPRWRPAAAGSLGPHTALVSLLHHLSFLLRAPELLRETYSKTATTQSRTRPINMTRTRCCFPTQTFKIGGIDINHGTLCGSLHSSPRCPCSTSCSPPSRRCGEDELQRQRQVLRRWQEVPSTLPLSPPALSQDRLTEAAGASWPSSRLSLNVLPSEGQPCLLCQGSCHQCNPPSCLLRGFYHRLAVLSPSGHSHGSGWLAITTGGWMQEKKKTEKHEAFLFGLFSAMHRKSGLPPLSCHGQYPQISILISMQDIDGESHPARRLSEHRGQSSKSVMWRTSPLGRQHLPPGSSNFLLLRGEGTLGILQEMHQLACATQRHESTSSPKLSSKAECIISALRFTPEHGEQGRARRELL